MDKININLYPYQKRLGGAFFQKIVTYKPHLIVVVVGISILILIFHLFIVFKMTVYQNYKKGWEDWEEEYNLITQIKREIIMLEEKKSDFQKVVSPKIEIARILGDVFSSLPKNIWFRSIQLKNDSLILKGYVVKWDEDPLISLDKKFISSLKRVEYFSSKFKEINIKNTRKTPFNNVEVLEFDIECIN